ncbi:OmpA family protein [Xanthomonas citri]|uniref:OmpA family protein n=1 Tax=Xanthomonas citri TaxID=346 RepID=UPI000C5270CE|nr:putative TraQ protein [Xanthomonas citri pv. fuscans]
MVRCIQSLNCITLMKISVSALICAVLGGCSTGLPSPSHFGRQPINQGAHVTTVPTATRGALQEPRPPLPGASAADVRIPINGAVEVYPAAERTPARVGTEQVFSIYYTPGGTRFQSDQATEHTLRALAPHASHVEIIGRTDGSAPTSADDEIALRRVTAVRRFLLSQGADPTKIYLQYASATDYVGDNTTSFGRSQNRRVDIRVK